MLFLTLFYRAFSYSIGKESSLDFQRENFLERALNTTSKKDLCSFFLESRATKKLSDSTSVRKTMEAYELSDRPASDFLADDTEYKIMATGETARGKGKVLEMLKQFYSDCFSEVKTTVRNIAADEEKGLGFIEFTFSRQAHRSRIYGDKTCGENRRISSVEYLRNQRWKDCRG